MNRLTL